MNNALVLTRTFAARRGCARPRYHFHLPNSWAGKPDRQVRNAPRGDNALAAWPDCALGLPHVNIQRKSHGKAGRTDKARRHGPRGEKYARANAHFRGAARLRVNALPFSLPEPEKPAGQGKWHEPNARIQHAATLNATRACAAKRNTNTRWGQPQVAFATSGGDGAARPQYN